MGDSHPGVVVSFCRCRPISLDLQGVTTFMHVSLADMVVAISYSSFYFAGGMAFFFFL